MWIIAFLSLSALAVSTGHVTCTCPVDQPPNPCGENEEIMECAPCVKTCDEVGKPIACPLACITTDQCYCRTGHVKGPDGKCIPIEECPKKPPIECGLNEEIPECVPCTQTCEHVRNPIFCTLDCRTPDRCYCMEGYVRGDHGKCVPRKCCSRDGQCLSEE